MNATHVLAGRRESALLALPSVLRMADILSQRCREPSWVRTSVASLERFRTMTGNADLEALREQALAEPVVAEQALAAFASCRTTGDFFREWGLPGSRFVGLEELPMEEYR